MKRLILSIVLPSLALGILLAAMSLTKGVADAQSPAPLTGTYAGTVVITNPQGLDALDLALVLTDTEGSLTGYIDAERLLTYPRLYGPGGRGPAVTGMRTQAGFSLQSIPYTNPVGVTHTMLLHTGIISQSGEIITGHYRETMLGLTDDPVVMIGNFRLTRQPHLPPRGQPVEIHVAAAPIHVRRAATSTVTARLVDYYSQPVSRTLVGLTVNAGTLAPHSATTDAAGEVITTFTAGSVAQPITFTANSGVINSLTNLYVFQSPYPVYLPILHKHTAP